MKKNLKFSSWNVNGIRACIKKGFWDWLANSKSDFACLQETKIAQKDFVPLMESHNITAIHSETDFDSLPSQGNFCIMNSAKRPGYSGVAVFTQHKPEKITFGLDDTSLNQEGRALFLHYPDFVLVNTYIPNVGRELDRMDFKLRYNDALLQTLETIRKKQKNIILCGDMNVAHEEIDLKNPKTNMQNAGFTPEERQWFDQFLQKKYVDTFRHQNPGLEGQYTWWSYRFSARQRNIGWRIDYFVTTKEALPNIKKSTIEPEQEGSDHCPIHLTYKI